MISAAWTLAYCDREFSCQARAVVGLAADFDVRLDLETLQYREVPSFAEGSIGFVPLLSSSAQRDERIGTKRHDLLLAVVMIVPAPQLAAAGGDEQKDPVGIGNLVGSIPRFSCANLCIAEYFWSPKASRFPAEITTITNLQSAG